VYYFHANTMHALADLLGSAGLQSPDDMSPQHLMVRNAHGQASTLASTIDTLTHGQLLQDSSGQAPLPSPFAEFWHASDAGHWGSAKV
jgi:hypothetical protein